MSLFGSLPPMFKFHAGLSDEAIVVLDYSIIDETQQDVVFVNESVANFHRDFEGFGEHREFRILIYLWNYGSDSEQLAKLNELKSYEFQNVLFYRHSDGNPYTDINGNYINYFIGKIKTHYITDTDFKTVVEIPFSSVDLVDGTSVSISQTEPKINNEIYYVSNYAQLLVAVPSILNSSRTVYITRSFSISDLFSCNLNSNNLELIGLSGTLLTSTYTTATAIETGAFKFYGGGTLRISNLDFYSYNTSLSPITHLISSLFIYNCSNVVLEGVHTFNAPYFGTHVIKCSELSVKNCGASLNLYGGLGITATKNVTVFGGIFSYNGYTAPVYGYGISCTQQLTYGVRNENVLIQGTTCNYNLRKGIDVHDGMNVKIVHNSVNGFGYGGIYAVNESSTFDAKDIIIAHNTIENDSTWFSGLTFTGTPNTHPIQFGTYGNIIANGSDGKSSWLCMGNILKNLSVAKSGVNYLNYAINAFTGVTDNIKILDCTITDSLTDNYLVYVGTGNTSEGQPLVVDIKNLTITRCTAEHLVLVSGGEKVNIDNVTFQDSTATLYAINVLNYGDGANIKQASISNCLFDVACTKYWSVSGSIHFATFFNRADLGIDPVDGSTIQLPDFANINSGSFRLNLHTSDTVPKTLDTLTVNTLDYVGGSCAMDIDIRVVGLNTGTLIRYNFKALAGNTANTPSFEISEALIDAYKNVDNAETLKPTLSWNTISASVKTLRISFPSPYFSYDIDIKFNSWRLQPYWKPV